jgi:hypothetical protein
MLLFRGEEHIGRWCAHWNQPAGAALTIHQAWQLARAWYGNKMSPDWRRFTLEETESLMAGLGLIGPFWNLRP